jgi:hypothetical protein
MSMSAVRKQLLRYLSRGVESAAEQFDSGTGRFLAANGGWAVTNQDVIFPLALLHETPGTAYYGDRKVLRLCLRGGDALRDWQDAEGRFEFIKTDGSRWGMIYMPWSIYHWLETWVLLRDRMDGARRRRWEKGLQLAYNGLARECATPRAHNIPTWNGMSLVRAGHVFDRADWVEAGRRQVLFSAAEQHPDGYWPEGVGPTTGYNLVYVHALGLYYAFTRDRAVLKPLRRAVRFHATFTYPDGSPVETVDGRQRYHRGPFVTGWPGLSIFPEGRRLVSVLCKSLMKQGRGGLIPHLASAWQHLSDGAEAPLPHEEQARIIYHGRALVRRSGPWFICMSGYVPPQQARPALSRNRWIITRANCLSVWHKRLGLLVGGGNSKHDPFFATFEVWTDGAMRIEPDRVTFSRLGNADVARFRFGKTTCTLSVKTTASGALEVEFQAPAQAARRGQVSAGLTLPLPAGTKLRWKRNHSAVLDPMQALGAAWTEKDRRADCVLKGEGWTISVPPECALSYPAYPFNPYAINDASPTEYAAAVLNIGFMRGRRRKIVLRAR